MTENYRPISILPSISKIFEQFIATRLYDYLERKNYLSPNQHGYRKGHSTTTGVADVINFIYDAFDNRKYAEMSMLDLSKAFDSVSPHILVEKLEFYGVRGNALELLQSYLSNRRQATEWGGSLSGTREINYGVPQGSILGPLLFIIYINDLPSNIRNASICLYADDTSIMVQGSEMGELRWRTNQSTEDANKWFAANRLKVNLGKTQCLLFTTKQGNENHEAKFLGLTLDTHLRWCQHINNLANRLTSALFAIRRLTRVATFQAAKTAYFAMFHSHLCYGIMFWGLASDAGRIFVLQKQAIRSLCSLQYNESCRTHFRKENVLTLVSVFILAVVCFVHSNLDQFVINGSTHEYNTRQRHELETPYHRLACSQRAVSYWGAKLYNKLPAECKCLPYQHFKAKVKKLLIELECYDIGEFLECSL